MAQLNSKQTITFSIDGILSSNSEEDNFRRSSVDYRENINKTETFASPGKSTAHVDNNATRAGNKCLDIKLDKHSGESDRFVFVVYFERFLQIYA